MMERIYKSLLKNAALFVSLVAIFGLAFTSSTDTYALRDGGYPDTPKVKVKKVKTIKKEYYVCTTYIRKKNKVEKKLPNGRIQTTYTWGRWEPVGPTFVVYENRSDLKNIKAHPATKTVCSRKPVQSGSSGSIGDSGNVGGGGGNYVPGSSVSAGKTLSCSNATSHFSKFYEYVDSKYKAVKKAGDEATKKQKEAWVATDKTLLESRAKQDTDIQAKADKLKELAKGDETKIKVAEVYIEALKTAIQDNRHFNDMARAGVDLTAENVGASLNDSYRAQVIEALNGKRAEYKQFMSKLVKNYDDATTAAKKNCNASTLNKLKSDTKKFKAKYKADLAKARKEYKEALQTIKEEYRKQIKESNDELNKATEDAFNILLSEW